MNRSNLIKEKIKSEIFNVVSNKQYIISTTIVGSFISSAGIEGISDIDIVIIVDKLTKKVFDEINVSFQMIESSKIGLDDYEIVVNSTFGPLKFNNEKNVVFHVMVYDLEGHVSHVEQSPFTCLSWENYKPIQGISLKEVYPVINVQLDDIIQSRRGVSSYLKDLNNGSITFRKYSFLDGKPYIVKGNFDLDSKHKLEYSFHITYHLLNNFYKIITREVDSLKNEDLISFYLNFKLFPSHIILFSKDLLFWKKKSTPPPLDALEKTRLFINEFFKCVGKLKKQSKIISFRRHEKTNLNDGTFLGIKRNPSIGKISKKTSDFNYQIGYHSELLRSRETITYYKTNELIENSLLNEIDYGLAEGFNIEQLHSEYPGIILGWKEGKDPSFPEGECQKDVLSRVREFLNKNLEVHKNSLVITHLVVLRMVLFNYLKLDFKNLYKIRIGHLEGFDILSFNKSFYVEIPKEIRTKIRKQLSILND